MDEGGNMKRITILSAVLVSLLSVKGLADPPSHVARINYLDGSVSVMRGDLDEWDREVVNYPLVAGDQLCTDQHARAELHLGSTAIRLDDRTAISLLNLNDHATQISVTRGTAELHINRLGADETYEIDTPDASATL